VYDPALADFLPTPVFAGEQLAAGAVIEGPAIVEYPTTTLAVCSGQRAELNELLGVEITEAA